MKTCSRQEMTEAMFDKHLSEFLSPRKELAGFRQ